MQSEDEDVLVDDLENLALDRPPSPSRITSVDSDDSTVVFFPNDSSEQLNKPDDGLSRENPNPADAPKFGKAISRASASRRGHMRGRQKSCLKPPRRQPVSVTGIKPTRVTFPVDGSIVSERIDAEDPWKNVREISVSQLVSEYRLACEKLRTRPLEKVKRQIQEFRGTACRLESLILSGVKLDDKACESLEAVLRKVQFEYIELENCSLEEEGATALFEMIEFYQSAFRLNISCNQKISSRGWHTACRMLKRTPCLYHLDARRTFLTDQTMPIFGRCLKVNIHLRVLQLEDSYLTGRPFLLLMTAMKYNKHLHELYLGHNDLTHSDANALCAMLSCNTTLQLLDVRNNAIKDLGLSHIGQGLANQSECHEGGLDSLVLWNNSITQEGLANLNDALAKTSSLKSLNIGQNKFGDSGMQRLKPGLMRNKSLQKLGLLNTKLGNEGAVALAEVLADSGSLRRIDVRGNRIHVAGLMAISLALKVNKTLTRLDLDKDLKKEPGMESVQQSVLADIYNYCYRNKLEIRSNSTRLVSLSEESSCSSTYSEEDFAVDENQYDSPDGTTDAINESGDQSELLLGRLELSLESSTVMPAIPASMDESAQSDDAPLVTLPEGITGRSRFTITRIVETVSHGISVSANVANKLVSNVGLDSITKTAARKLSRGEKEMMPLADQSDNNSTNDRATLSLDSKGDATDSGGERDIPSGHNDVTGVSCNDCSNITTNNFNGVDLRNGDAQGLSSQLRSDVTCHGRPTDVTPCPPAHHTVVANAGIVVVE